eukprot:4946776-Amphidinium_carterae.1
MAVIQCGRVYPVALLLLALTACSRVQLASTCRNDGKCVPMDSNDSTCYRPPKLIGTQALWVG